MRFRHGNLDFFGLGVAFIMACLPREALSQPSIRVDKAYEDSVRILILYNKEAIGHEFCNPTTIPVGERTKEFTVQSLAGIANVKVLPAQGPTWDTVVGLWPGKLPQVIVHVNAGFYTTAGNDIEAVLNTAADLKIGVVSIGDDAAFLASKVFGIVQPDNVPAPIGDGTGSEFTGPNSRLWIPLDGKADTLPAPGIIRNTVTKLGVTDLDFKSFSDDGTGEYRCQADADKYQILPGYLDKLTFLGFQRGFNGTDTVATAREVQTIVAFQDGIRRGVALSFQPQFLKNKLAASQIVYDAVIYASYAHKYKVTPPPPPEAKPNPVLSAYIKDLDGDGAGDHVYVAFTDSLAMLPKASVGSVFWNSGASAFGNKSLPTLGFLPDSGNKVVVYDFSASEFPPGRTGIPAGANPYVALPAGTVFGAQKPAIADSMGPILIKATLVLQNAQQLAKDPSLPSVDTLVIKTSEPIQTATDWESLIRYSAALPGGRCADYAASAPVNPLGSPHIGNDSLTYILYMNKDIRNPAKGDCVFLTVDGTYSDMRSNAPPKFGIPIGGEDPPRQLQVVRAYPPVAGIDTDNPKFKEINPDPRKGDPTAPGPDTWIPPVNFTKGVPFMPPIPTSATGPNDPSLVDNTTKGKMPPGISTVQIVSAGRYIVTVNIYDHLGNFIKTFRQSFGYFGETFNRERITDKGFVSYLVWDMKDSKGESVGQGVYVWRLSFLFDNHKKDVKVLRTGLLRGS